MKKNTKSDTKTKNLSTSGIKKKFHFRYQKKKHQHPVSKNARADEPISIWNSGSGKEHLEFRKGVINLSGILISHLKET